MVFFENYSLKKLNTFAINAKAKYFTSIKKSEDILELIEKDIFKENQHFVLGGGSNVLFQNDFEGLIIHIENKGIEIVKEEENFVFVKASAGEDWDKLVEFAVENEFYGIENLSLIPGTVGASPVQNIGAYGTELKDVFYEAEIFNLTSGQKEFYNSEMCNFAYRNSIFKNELKNKLIVISVTLKLNKRKTLNLSYKEVNKRLLEIKNPTIKDVRDVIIEIRTEKLPNPKIIPNAGSFFKNPIILKSKYEKLIGDFPNLISYPFNESNVKLAAGQMIEMCGWKSKQYSKVAVHKNQSLVIINKNNASGKEIIEFSEAIQDSVNTMFGVKIEPEVNIV